MGLIARLANTQTGLVAKSAALLLVERSARRELVAAIRSLSQRVSELESRLEKKNLAIEDLGKRLYAARLSADQDRAVHRDMAEQTTKLLGATIDRLTRDGTEAALRAEEAVARLVEVAGWLGLKEHEVNLVNVSHIRQEANVSGARKSVLDKLQVVIRDALDPHGKRYGDSIENLVLRTARELADCRQGMAVT